MCLVFGELWQVLFVAEWDAGGGGEMCHHAIHMEMLLQSSTPGQGLNLHLIVQAF